MTTSQAEIDRRYANVRAQAQEDGLDAVVVAGSEYTGFEGAVRYLSGFRLLHRYAYVVLPVEGEPSVVFPKEARWVGDHGEAWIEDKVFAEHPGQWIADRGFKKIGVYGLDYVMPVRDYRPLADVAVAVGPGLRHRPRGQVRGGARLGRGELPAERGRRPRRARRRTRSARPRPR